MSIYNRSPLAAVTGANFEDPLANGPMPASAAASPLAAAANQPRDTRNLDPELRRQLNERTGARAQGVRIVPTSAAAPAPTAAAGDAYGDLYADALAGAESALGGYQGALQAARDAESTSIANRMRLQQGYVDQLGQPQRSDMLGAFGAALLQPTSTGSFAEGWGNAANAAMKQRAEERRDREVREEKRLRAQMALEELRAMGPSGQLRALDDQLGYLENVNKVTSLRADETLRRDIGNGLTPTSDEALVADAERFPSKYAGVLGQQKVAEARARLSTASDRQWELQKMQEQNRLDIAKQEAKRGTAGGALADLTPSEEKMASAAHTNVLATQDNLQLLDEAQRIDDTGYVMGGYAPRAFTTAGKVLGDYVGQGWVPDAVFGSPEQQEATQRYYQVMDPASLERMKQALGPGVMTDADLRFALGVYADPNATQQARQQARATIRRRFEAQGKVSRAQLNRLLGPEGSAELLGETPNGAEGQGDGGGGRYLTPEQGSTLKQAIQHAQQNKAWSGVAKRLNDMGFTITAEQLRQLTPAQVDQLIKSAQ